MKNILRLSLAAILSVLLLTACSNDKEKISYTKTLIGQWKLKEKSGWYLDDNMQKQEYSYNEKDNPEQTNYYLVFLEEDNGYEITDGADGRDFTWFVFDDQIYVYWAGSITPYKYTITRITNSKIDLTLSGYTDTYSDEKYYKVKVK